MFDTSIHSADGVLTGPLRHPRQMLAGQDYGGHASMHDDAAAQAAGFRGGAIEGPTHFSQIVPLCVAHWGADFLAHGCLSAHYRTPAFDGDALRATLAPLPDDPREAAIGVQSADGTEILRGSASHGPGFGPTALDRRLAGLSPLDQPVILRDVRVGARVPRVPVRIDMDQPIGPLYPFSLADKLRAITEPSPAYNSGENPWGRPVLPFEMISVLMQYTWDDTAFGFRGPALGMFADQEIRLYGEPVLVAETYELDREVVFLSGSRRTESAWIRSRLFRPGASEPTAMMLLNSAVLKDTYAPYAAEHAALYGAG